MKRKGCFCSLLRKFQSAITLPLEWALDEGSTAWQGHRKAKSLLMGQGQRERQVPGSHSPLEPMSLALPQSPPHKGSTTSQCCQPEDQALNSSYSRAGGAGVSPGSPEAAVSFGCGQPTCYPLGSTNAPDSCSPGPWGPETTALPLALRWAAILGSQSGTTSCLSVPGSCLYSCRILLLFPLQGWGHTVKWIFYAFSF